MVFGHAISSRTPCWEPQAEDKPWPLRGRSLQSGYALRNSQERWAHNLLYTKHFHAVPSASPHAYSLKSRYGKVRVNLFPHWCNDNYGEVCSSALFLDRARVEAVWIS